MIRTKEETERMLAARSRFFHLVAEARALQQKAYAERRATPAEKRHLYELLNAIDRTLTIGAQRLKAEGILEDDPDPVWRGEGQCPYTERPLPFNYCLTDDGRNLPVRLKFFTRVLIMRKWQIRLMRTGQSGACYTRLFEWQAAVDALTEAGEIKDQLDALRD